LIYCRKEIKDRQNRKNLVLSALSSKVGLERDSPEATKGLEELRKRRTKFIMTNARGKPFRGCALVHAHGSRTEKKPLKSEAVAWGTGPPFKRVRGALVFRKKRRSAGAKAHGGQKS